MAERDRKAAEARAERDHKAALHDTAANWVATGQGGGWLAQALARGTR